MITCSNCNTQNEDGSTFCGECGNLLNSNSSQTNNNLTSSSVIAKAFPNMPTALRKGLTLIIGGVLLFFVVPLLFRWLVPSQWIWEYKLLIGIISMLLFTILPLAMVIVGIILIIRSNNSKTNMNQPIVTSYSTNLEIGNFTQNQVVKVSLTGGLIGLFIGNPTQKLNNQIDAMNNAGWSVVQVLPDKDTNLITIFIRLLLVLITLLLYTTKDGYYIVYRKTQ